MCISHGEHTHTEYSEISISYCLLETITCRSVYPLLLSFSLSLKAGPTNYANVEPLLIASH